ncbi:putative ABC transporter permease [Bacilliculturomica massiliensis]|uniref:putative ABC transporter permease n=1 Tax=Bacilliculturomica massiliensis TaxID=1917867 RepID=UPI001FE6F923|nr:hypothetical protein [Bacilliculturomica massiliensis]
MENELSPFQKKIILFFIGAVGYSVIEVSFRGYTHWTMALTGGFVFLLLYGIQTRMGDRPLWLRCLAGAGIITGVEFIVGCVVNLWLGWNVWDYSMFRFQVLGQVCLLFSFLWFLLCGPIFYIAQKMRQSWNG